MTRVLLVEDQRMSRDSVTAYLNSSRRYNLVAHTPNAGMAEILCMRYKVDLVLMDVRTETNEDGILAAATIKRHLPHIKVIIITSMTTVDLIDRAHKACVDSFWYKEVEGSELLEVMDRTMDGEHVFPGATPIVRIGNMLSSEISNRELDVLRLMVRGYSDADIAKELVISTSTVRYHITQLLQKSGYDNRVKLIVDLINQDFLVPGL